MSNEHWQPYQWAVDQIRAECDARGWHCWPEGFDYGAGFGVVVGTPRGQTSFILYAQWRGGVYMFSDINLWPNKEDALRDLLDNLAYETERADD